MYVCLMRFMGKSIYISLDNVVEKISKNKLSKSHKKVDIQTTYMLDMERDYSFHKIDIPFLYYKKVSR